MKENPANHGRFSRKAKGLGTVTREMVQQRARELAVISGRSADQVLDSDLDQARRELTGEERVVPNPTAAEQLPEDERWDPVAGSQGHAAPTVPASDEQTLAEKLTEEGVEDAEQDQMLRATRQAERRDRQK